MSGQEIILAQEQSVRCREGLGKEVQGTLVLTNRRLLFVAADEEQVLLAGYGTIRFADVEDLATIPKSPLNIFIPLESVTSTKGFSGVITDPSIKVKYLSGNVEKEVEFVQTIIGGRKKNLNDWAKVIEDVQKGKRVIKIPTELPSKDSLEGRILRSLADLQEKGVFEIETEIENNFNVELDPDEVEAACERLVSTKLISKVNESGVDFYRMPSPLGEDELSS